MPLIRGSPHSSHRVEAVPGMNLLCTTVCTRASCNHLQHKSLQTTRKPSVLNQRMPSSASAHVQVIAGALELGALVTGGGSIVGGVVAEVCLHTNVSVSILLLFSLSLLLFSVTSSWSQAALFTTCIFFSRSLSSKKQKPSSAALICPSITQELQVRLQDAYVLAFPEQLSHSRWPKATIHCVDILVKCIPCSLFARDLFASASALQRIWVLQQCQEPLLLLIVSSNFVSLALHTADLRLLVPLLEIPQILFVELVVAVLFTTVTAEVKSYIIG